MPPKKAAPKAAAVPRISAPGRGGRQKAPARGKKEEEDELSDEDLEEKEPVKAAPRKRGPAKKQPASEEEDEFDDEEMDDDEDFDEDDEDDDDEEDEDFEGKAKGGKPKQATKGQKTLFIKNLPTETTPEQVKALSADIQEVRMDVSQSKSEKNPKYAILEFGDADTAERNLKQLKGQKVNGVEIYVDYVGGKVKYTKPQLTPSSDPLKLYVTGFGRDIVIDQLKEMFPTSSDITLPLNDKDNNRPVGYAFIHYTEEAGAKEAHDSMQDYVYQGRTLVVMYGKKSTPETEKAALQAKRKAPPAKGTAAKKSKKNPEDDEDEEDEDEEEDEEDEPDEEEEELDEEDEEEEDNE